MIAYSNMALIRFWVLAWVLSATAVLTIGHNAWAADFYVQDTVADNGISTEDAQATTQLVKSSVSSRSGDVVTDDQFEADYVLQPRLMRLGSSYILTIEKRMGDEVIFAAQSKISRIDQLDGAVRSVTAATINEPSRRTPEHGIASEAAPAAPYRVTPPEPNAPSTRSQRSPASDASTAPSTYSSSPSYGQGRSTAPVVDVLPPRKIGYWTLGVGPFIPRHLDTEDMMYGFTLGHTWDINPRAAVKVLGEASLSSGDSGARFFNIGTGASFFLPGSIDNAPYITGDIGYGFAEDANDDTAEGFSFGTGVGFQFFRTTETTLDLLLRYNVVLNAINDGGNPSVIGLRLAVNF